MLSWFVDMLSELQGAKSDGWDMAHRMEEQDGGVWCGEFKAFLALSYYRCERRAIVRKYLKRLWR